MGPGRGRGRRRSVADESSGMKRIVFYVAAALLVFMVAGPMSGASAAGALGGALAIGSRIPAAAVNTATAPARSATSTAAALQPAAAVTTTTASVSQVTIATTVPAFKSSIKVISGALKIRMIDSGSWKPGDPITFSKLRLIQVTYWGFDSKAHTGSLVVNAQWAAKLCAVFQKLYDARFPIRSMNLIDNYGASDRKSMNADNTSCYNGRWRGGTTDVWSMHAYGLAIDINTVENPWVYSSGVSPEAGRAYTNRSLTAKGMIHAGDVVVKAFASIGWTWGGSWSSSRDYQHFSSNGE